MATLKKSDPLRLFGRRLLIVLLALLVLGVAWGLWGIYRKDVEAAGLRAQAEAQLADLTARQQTLQQDYDQLSSARGTEEVLRDSYAVGKSGEGMIVIVEPQAPRSSAAPASPWDWIEKLFSW